MIKKLRIKFVCVNMLFAACMLVITIVALTSLMGTTIARERSAELHRLAEEPKKKMRPSTEGKFIMASFVLEYGPDGKLNAFGSDSFDLSDEDELAALFARVMAEEKADGVLKDYGLRYYRTSTPMGPKAVFADTYAERTTVRYLMRSSVVLAVVTYVLLFALSIPISRVMVRPVDRAWQQQKRFVADASHELKTPLTVIIANAELLQQPGYDETQRKNFTDSILTMARHMRYLVESLLELARLDNVKSSASVEKLDYSALVEDCLLPFEPLYFERGLLLETEVEKDLRVRGNAQTLRQCVDILLDNAWKYSEPGRVKLRLRRAGRVAELTVSNPCPELSRRECKDVFKRFYRRDEARTATGSYGLGLPIAEGIVTRHRGKINCSWEAGEICFTVTLPLMA